MHAGQAVSVQSVDVELLWPQVKDEEGSITAFSINHKQRIVFCPDMQHGTQQDAARIPEGGETR